MMEPYVILAAASVDFDVVVEYKRFAWLIYICCKFFTFSFFYINNGLFLEIKNKGEKIL